MSMRAPLLVAVTAALAAATVAQAKIPPCPGGRYLVVGGPLLESTDAPPIDVVEMSGRMVSIASGCDLAKGRVHGTKAGTRLRVRFKSCQGVIGKALVKGLITDGCHTLDASFAIRRLHVTKPFVATLSSCGDGVWDPDGGEECDGTLGPCGALCNACSCTGVTTTTTSTTASPTTTAAGGTSTTSTSTSSMPVFTTTSTTTTTLATKADLVPIGWSSPSSAPARAGIAVDFTVKNQGVATAVAPWWEYVLWSTDTNFGGDTAIFGYQRNSNLAAGAQYSAPTQTVQVPNVAAGTYFFFFQTDGANAVPEDNDANNVIGPIQITVSNADLTPTALTPPASATAGAVVTISYSIKNQAGAVAYGPWNDQLVLSSDMTHGNADDIAMLTAQESVAGANATYTRNQLVVIPNVAPGAYYVFLETDQGNQLYESNEGNNLRGPVAITIN